MGRMEEMEARLKSRMDAMNKHLADRMAAVDAKLGIAPVTASVTNAAAYGQADGCDLQTYNSMARADVAGIGTVFADFMQPSGVEMAQLFEYVRRAPVVQDNQVYAATMNRVRFEYNIDPNNVEHNKVNANAGLDKNGVPVIRIFGGAARIGRVAALSIATMKYGNDGDAVKRFIATLKPAQCHTFTVNDAIQVTNDAKLVTALRSDGVIVNAKSISAGLMLGIIAHEAGHLSLGHSFSRGNYYKTNLEVARNREREADSFSSSVIATSPFGESILEGTLLWYYVLASHERGEESTHPLSRERFMNIVNSNKELARKLGIELAE